MLFVVNLISYTLPTIVFTPLAGVVTDRRDRRWVMILADAGAGIGTLSILLAL
jgi:MFS family permease